MRAIFFVILLAAVLLWLHLSPQYLFYASAASIVLQFFCYKKAPKWGTLCFYLFLASVSAYGIRLYQGHGALLAVFSVVVFCVVSFLFYIATEMVLADEKKDKFDKERNDKKERQQQDIMDYKLEHTHDYGIQVFHHTNSEHYRFRSYPLSKGAILIAHLPGFIDWRIYQRDFASDKFLPDQDNCNFVYCTQLLQALMQELDGDITGLRYSPALIIKKYFPETFYHNRLFATKHQHDGYLGLQIGEVGIQFPKDSIRELELEEWTCRGSGGYYLNIQWKESRHLTHIDLNLSSHHETKLALQEILITISHVWNVSIQQKLLNLN